MAMVQVSRTEMVIAHLVVKFLRERKELLPHEFTIPQSLEIGCSACLMVFLDLLLQGIGRKLNPGPVRSTSQKSTNFLQLPPCVVITFLREWILSTDVCKLDSSVCTKSLRQILLDYVGKLGVVNVDSTRPPPPLGERFFAWLFLRGLTVQSADLDSGFNDMGQCRQLVSAVDFVSWPGSVENDRTVSKLVNVLHFGQKRYFSNLLVLKINIRLLSSADIVHYLLPVCENLHTLQLNFDRPADCTASQPFNTTDVLKILSSCQSTLVNLTLCNASDIPGGFLKECLSLCPNLLCLELCNTMVVPTVATSPTFHKENELSCAFTHSVLHTLKLTDTRSKNNKSKNCCLLNLLAMKAVPSLNTLVLSGNYRVSFEVMCKIASHWTELEFVDLSSCAFIDFWAVLKARSTLKALSVLSTDPVYSKDVFNGEMESMCKLYSPSPWRVGDATPEIMLLHMEKMEGRLKQQRTAVALMRKPV